MRYQDLLRHRNVWLGVAMVLEKWKVSKWINSFLALCGDYSFELYLVHLLVWVIPACFCPVVGLLTV